MELPRSLLQSVCTVTGIAGSVLTYHSQIFALCGCCGLGGLSRLIAKSLCMLWLAMLTTAPVVPMFFAFCPAAYNDYQLHTFCLTYHHVLGQYLLPPTCLMASGKLVALDALLKELKAAGSRPLIFSQVGRRDVAAEGVCRLPVMEAICWQPADKEHGIWLVLHPGSRIMLSMC